MPPLRLYTLLLLLVVVLCQKTKPSPAKSRSSATVGSSAERPLSARAKTIAPVPSASEREIPNQTVRKTKPNHKKRRRQKGAAKRKKSDRRKWQKQLRAFQSQSAADRACLQWTPDLKVEVNATERSIFVDYCASASSPQTSVCAMANYTRDQYQCHVLDQDKCNTSFHDLREGGRYTILVRAQCRCRHRRVDPCAITTFYSDPYRIPEIPVVEQRIKKGSLSVPTVIIITSSAAALVGTIGFVIAFYCRRRKHPQNANAQVQEIPLQVMNQRPLPEAPLLPPPVSEPADRYSLGPPPDYCGSCSNSEDSETLLKCPLTDTDSDTLYKAPYAESDAASCVTVYHSKHPQNAAAAARDAEYSLARVSVHNTAVPCRETVPGAAAVASGLTAQGGRIFVAKDKVGASIGGAIMQNRVSTTAEVGKFTTGTNVEEKVSKFGEWEAISRKKTVLIGAVAGLKHRHEALSDALRTMKERAAVQTGMGITCPHFNKVPPHTGTLAHMFLQNADGDASAWPHTTPIPLQRVEPNEYNMMTIPRDILYMD